MDLGAGLHAEHHVVSVGILTAEVVRIVGEYHGDVEFAFQPEERLVDLLFLLEALVLNFEIEISAAEDVLILGGRGLRFFVVVVDQVLAQLAAQAA